MGGGLSRLPFVSRSMGQVNLTRQYKGNVLEAMRHYENVPGVGRYTSQAVMIFATNADLVTVDTNIRRILIHEFQLPHDVSERQLWELA